MLQSRRTSSAFSAPFFIHVWLTGLVWHLTRWGVAFLGTFLINELTGSPRLVQLAGTLLYGPLLVGGLIGGIVSDRFDRLRTVRVQLLSLIPLSLLLGYLVRADRVALWIIYLYMFVVGIGWVTDMTSRRALVFDLVGEERIDHAMAMESMSLSGGMVLGALVGGSVVQAVGVGTAYYVIGGLLLLAILIQAPVKSAPRQQRPAAGSSPGLVDGMRLLRSNRGLVSILGVTVIANFFLFAYFPIVPVVAERVDATPFLVGLLVAGTGIGMMTGSMVMARWAPRRRGLFYVGGLFISLTFLLPFSHGTTYPVVLVAIICSGFGSGFFGATQTALVMTAAPEEQRGLALGFLSMAIGALPVGMYVLGEVAERAGVPAAISVNAVLGAAALVAWLWWRPEVRFMTTATDAATGLD